MKNTSNQIRVIMATFEEENKSNRKHSLLDSSQSAVFLFCLFFYYFYLFLSLLRGYSAIKQLLLLLLRIQDNFIAKCQYNCTRNVLWCQVQSSHIHANHKALNYNNRKIILEHSPFQSQISICGILPDV